MTTLIYESIHGSRAYGLARAGSDVDRKGVLVGPKRWYFGFRGGPEQIEPAEETVHYELRKMLRLLAKANPTVLELLFTDPEHHTVITAAGRRLLDARRTFLTRRVGQSFGGYAMGQLKRIRTHRRWLLHPPEDKPRREDFGLPREPAIPRDQLGAAEALETRGTLSPNYLEVLGREKRYRAAKQEWDQFQQWKKHRNPKRAALEAEHGYDTKHAMHLVRLQRMGAEILERGEVIVTRPDRDELLAVRDGAWTYERLVEEADANMARIRALTESSELPEAADEDAIEALGVSLIDEVLS